MQRQNTPLSHAPRLGAHPSRTLLFALLTAVSTLPAHAAGAWVWVDESGRKVYSDLPPPASVSDRQIVQQPTAGARIAPLPAAASDTPASAPSAATPAAAPPKPDPAEEKKRKEAQQAEEARRKAVEAKNAEIRAENCKRATSAISTLKSNMRLMTTDAQGRQVIMSSQTRSDETRRLEQIIAENCR